ncbi:MAG: 30S ribosomal protein S18 [Bdellovibrionaceae bacterium]|nr:30S ribosomal protein S18 [Pseudobdellovibrionaceae bacterium]
MKDKGTDRGERSDRGDRGDSNDNTSLRKVIRNKYRSDLKGDHVFDYKDPASLSRYISEGGKITPARISKLSLNQQKKLASAIKKARNLSLLPQGSLAYDDHGYPEMISPKPFSF